MGIQERRQREREERRQQIMNAAELVFLERGLSGATMEEVASRAELSKGTLYLYFKSKDELYVATLNRLLGAMVARFEAVIGAPGSGIEVLERIIRGELKFALEHPDHARFGTTWMNTAYRLAEETPSFDEYRSHIGRLFQCVSSAIERGREDGTIHAPGETLELVVQLWGSLLGVSLLSANSAEILRRIPGPVDMEHLVEGYCDLLMKALR